MRSGAWARWRRYFWKSELSERLKLNLRVYRSDLSPAWQEARFGRRWEQGLKGIEAYNQANKAVEHSGAPIQTEHVFD